MNWYLIFALMITILTSFGGIVGFVIHPLFGASIIGLGSYIVYTIGKHAGAQEVVEYLREEFNITLNTLKD